jgi:hypothetical protein
MSKIIEIRAATGILSKEVAADARARNDLEVPVATSRDSQAEQRAGVEKEMKTWVNDGADVGEIIWGMLGL